MARMPAKIGVFVLAGNRLFRESLASILKSKSDIRVVGTASCTSAAFAQVEGSGCDVLLVDPTGGDRMDLPFVREITRMAPKPKLVLIDMVDDHSILLKAIQAGAVGYILQSASALDIVAAVRSVHQGEAVCPPQLCRSLFEYVARLQKSVLSFPLKAKTGLTRREQQLVPLIAQGFTNKEIGCQLHLSEQTVKNHIHRVLQKTGASSRFAVVEMVREQSIAM
jgi:two-component system response regulator DevR